MSLTPVPPPLTSTIAFSVRLPSGLKQRLDLRVRALAGLGLEQHVVIGVRVEWRVEVDEVDDFVGDILAQHRQIVAVVQLVGHSRPFGAQPIRLLPDGNRSREGLRI